MSNGKNLIQKPDPKLGDVVLVTKAPYDGSYATVTTVGTGGSAGLVVVSIPLTYPSAGTEVVNLHVSEFKIVGNLNRGKMPRQKRGESRQDYGTPDVLIKACTQRFGPLVVDLAATAENAKCPVFITPEQDSLRTDWAPYLSKGIGWLNPPFGKITPWAERCAKYGQMGFRILFHTPFTSANWCVEWIKPYARILPLNPRVTYVGESHCYIKDTQVAAFGFGATGVEYWENWDTVPWTPRAKTNR